MSVARNVFIVGRGVWRTVLLKSGKCSDILFEIALNQIFISERMLPDTISKHKKEYYDFKFAD